MNQYARVCMLSGTQISQCIHDKRITSSLFDIIKAIYNMSTYRCENVEIQTLVNGIRLAKFVYLTCITACTEQGHSIECTEQGHSTECTGQGHSTECTGQGYNQTAGTCIRNTMTHELSP